MENNREPLYLHSMSKRKMRRGANPVRTLTTFDGLTNIGGIATTVVIEQHADTSSIDGKKKQVGFDQDGGSFDNLGDSKPETFQLHSLSSQASKSATLVNKI